MVIGTNICDGVIIVTTDSGIYTIIENVHPAYLKIKQLIQEGKPDETEPHLDVIDSIASYATSSDSGFVLKNEMLYFNDIKLNGVIVDQVISMMNEGHDLTPLSNFMTNLFENPSNTVVNEMYDFINSSAADKFTLTSDGCFLAYKRVNNDYTDCYTGKIDNSVGAKPSMPRNQVDDNRNNTCSRGLHFCSLEYLRSFHGDRCMIVKVNPKDVVSIPVDYNHSKGRTWTYEVVGELTEEQFEKALSNNTGIFNSSVTTEYSTQDPNVEIGTLGNEWDSVWYTYEEAAEIISNFEQSYVSTNAVRKRASRGNWPKKRDVDNLVIVQLPKKYV